MRKSHDLSQEKLAEKVGLYYTYIGTIEEGERNISLQNIEKIAHALGIDITKLFIVRQGKKNHLFEEIVNLLTVAESQKRLNLLQGLSRLCLKNEHLLYLKILFCK